MLLTLSSQNSLLVFRETSGIAINLYKWQYSSSSDMVITPDSVADRDLNFGVLTLCTESAAIWIECMRSFSLTR